MPRLLGSWGVWTWAFSSFHLCPSTSAARGSPLLSPFSFPQHCQSMAISSSWAREKKRTREGTASHRRGWHLRCALDQNLTMSTSQAGLSFQEARNRLMALFFQMPSNTESPACVQVDSIMSLCEWKTQWAIRPKPRGTDMGTSLPFPARGSRSPRRIRIQLVLHKSCCGAASVWLGSARTGCASAHRKCSPRRGQMAHFLQPPSRSWVGRSLPEARQAGEARYEWTAPWRLTVTIVPRPRAVPTPDALARQERGSVL